MAEPINTDARLHVAMLKAHLEDPDQPVDLEGPLYQPKIAEQKKRLREASGELVSEYARERLLDHVIRQALDVGSDVLGGVAAAVETLRCAVRNIDEGDQLNAAVKREYGVGACLELCKSILPPGFVEHVMRQFVDSSSDCVSPGALEVENILLKSPDAEAVKAGIIANCQDGQRYALEHGIGSRRELETALRENPAFSDRYNHDIAFRLGTDSVVWVASHIPLDSIPGLPTAIVSSAPIELRG